MRNPAWARFASAFNIMLRSIIMPNVNPATKAPNSHAAIKNRILTLLY